MLLIWKRLWANSTHEINNMAEIRNIKTGRILKSRISKTGYRIVNLSERGIQKTWKVHRLVMMAFHGRNPLDVNHIDGDKLNNKLDNLEYISRSENHKHAFRIGLKINDPLKFSASRRGFTWADIKYIRNEYKQGRTLRDIGREMKITSSHVYSIISNAQWFDPRWKYQPRRLKEKEIKLLMELYSKGVSTFILAKNFKRHERHIRFIINRERTR